MTRATTPPDPSPSPYERVTGPTRLTSLDGVWHVVSDAQVNEAARARRKVWRVGLWGGVPTVTSAVTAGTYAVVGNDLTLATGEPNFGAWYVLVAGVVAGVSLVTPHVRVLADRIGPVVPVTGPLFRGPVKGSPAFPVTPAELAYVRALDVLSGQPVTGLERDLVALSGFAERSASARALLGASPGDAEEGVLARALRKEQERVDPSRVRVEAACARSDATRAEAAARALTGEDPDADPNPDLAVLTPNLNRRALP